MGNLGGIGDLAPFLLQGYTQGTLGREQWRRQEEERRRREAMQQQELALKYLGLQEEAAGRQDTARYRGEELELRRREGEETRKSREGIAGMNNSARRLNLLLNAIKAENFSMLAPEQKQEILQSYAEEVLQQQREEGTPPGQERLPFPGSVARDPETGALNVKPPELQHSPRLQGQIDRDRAYTGLAGAQTEVARAQAEAIPEREARLAKALEFDIAYKREQLRQSAKRAAVQAANEKARLLLAQMEQARSGALDLARIRMLDAQRRLVENTMDPRLKAELEFYAEGWRTVPTASGAAELQMDPHHVWLRQQYMKALGYSVAETDKLLGGGATAPPGASSLAPAAPGAVGQGGGPDLAGMAGRLADQVMALKPDVDLSRLEPFAMALRQFSQMLPQAAVGTYNTLLGQALQILDGRLDMSRQAQGARAGVARILKDMAARAGQQAPSTIGMFGNARYAPAGPPVGRQAPRQADTSFYQGPLDQENRSAYAGAYAGPASQPRPGRGKEPPVLPPAGNVPPDYPIWSPHYTGPKPKGGAAPKATVTERPKPAPQPRYPNKPKHWLDDDLAFLEEMIQEGSLAAYMSKYGPQTPEGKQMRQMYRFLKGKAYDPLAAPGRRTAPAGGR